MSDELKPCPFCGTRLIKNGPFSRRNADCFVHVQFYQGRDYGRCPSAGFRLFSDDAERIALWNTRAQGPSPGEIEAAYKRGWSDCEDGFLGRAAEILPPGSVASPGPGEAVAWRVKDFADGWTLCATKAEADALSYGSAGARIEPLYAPTPTREA